MKIKLIDVETNTHDAEVGWYGEAVKYEVK